MPKSGAEISKTKDESSSTLPGIPPESRGIARNRTESFIKVGPVTVMRRISEATYRNYCFFKFLCYCFVFFVAPYFISRTLKTWLSVLISLGSVDQEEINHYAG